MSNPSRKKKGQPVQPSIRNMPELRGAVTPLLPTQLQAGDLIVDLSSVITEKEAHEATLLLGIIIRDHFAPLLAEQGFAVTKSIGLAVGTDRVLRGRLKAIKKA